MKSKVIDYPEWRLLKCFDDRDHNEDFHEKNQETDWQELVDWVEKWGIAAGSIDVQFGTMNYRFVCTKEESKKISPELLKEVYEGQLGNAGASDLGDFIRRSSVTEWEPLSEDEKDFCSSQRGYLKENILESASGGIKGITPL